MVNVADYFASQLRLFDECESAQESPDSSFGRTFPGPFQATEDWIFDPCLKKSQRPKFQCLDLVDGRTPEWCEALSVRPRGASSTLNIGEFPNVAVESSLSQILQPEKDVPEKYYLSRRACQGILRRAKERGKELPEELRIALERQAGYMDLIHGQVSQTVRR